MLISTEVELKQEENKYANQIWFSIELYLFSVQKKVSKYYRERKKRDKEKVMIAANWR